MVAGVTEIANKAKVSKGLVSRYLNSDPNLKIKPETMIRIDKAKKVFDNSKLSQDVNSSFAGNFVIPINTILQNMSMAEIIEGTGIKPLEQVLKKNGFSVSLIFVDDNSKMGAIKRLIDHPNFCDGIIFLTAMANKKLAKLVLDNRMPHVSIDSRDEALGLNTVLAHSLLGISQALDHLVELGHKDIGYIGRNEFYRCTRFFTAMMDKGLNFREELNIYISRQLASVPEAKWRDLAFQGFSTLYDESSSATAYICQDDEIAFGVMDAMRQKGLEPGKDISIVGYDNIEERSMDYKDAPVLTTIDNPRDAIGRRCGEILIGQVLHDQTDIVHEYMPTKLIVRKTTGIYRDN